MAEKSTVLKELDWEFQALKKTLDGLSDKKLAEVWFGQWSAINILTHVAGWLRETTGPLERLARGERANPEGTDYSDADSWNARFIQEAGPLSPADAFRLLDTSYDRFRRAAELVPEDRFAEGRTAHRIVTTNGANHFREHAEQVRRWRSAQPA